MKNVEKLIYFICLFILAGLFSAFVPVKAGQKQVKIILDPGHGGGQSGAEKEYDGETIYEKNLNLKIATYLKEELTKYDGVTVYMTREDDEDVGLEERTQIGVDCQADVLISLHNNAKGERFAYDHGCTVLVSQGQYKKELGEEGQKLGVNILYELSGLGIEDQGLLLRDSENGGEYDNGSTADYYAIVRNGMKHDLLSVLIEHAFLDHEEDYEKYLSDDDKLKELAKADARGIARYYGLGSKDKGEKLPPLVNQEEILVHVIDENPDHNMISKKTFYKEKKAEKQSDSSQEDSKNQTDVKRSPD